MICQACKKSFPDRFFSPFVTNQGTMVLDPECARKEIEKIHGIKYPKFKGEYANQLHDNFIAWKERKL